MRQLTIRTRITLWYTIMLLFFIGAFGSFIYISMARLMRAGEENLLKAHAAQAESAVEIENGRLTFADAYEFVTPGTYITIYNQKNQVIYGNGMEKDIADRPPVFDQIRKTGEEDHTWLIYDHPIYNGNQLAAWVRASRSLAQVDGSLQGLGWMMVIAVPLYLLIAIGGGLFLARKALSPIDEITRTASAIGRGDLSQRLKLPKVEDEVGRLAETFDQMLDRLETAFIKERQFTSDASHELRTPIAVIAAQAEGALSGDSQTHELRESLAVILGESKKMGQMVSQLLMLTRGDEKKYQLERERVDLAIIVEEVVETMQEAADQKKVALSLEKHESVSIELDQMLITQLLMNIIENAIKYNEKGGWVKVTLSHHNVSAQILVEDNGIGIPREDLPYIFDRFYRVDKSRSREGTGLGLSIVKWIVDIHKGRIKVDTEQGQGTRVYIELPMVSQE